MSTSTGDVATVSVPPVISLRELGFSLQARTSHPIIALTSLTRKSRVVCACLSSMLPKICLALRYRESLLASSVLVIIAAVQTQRCVLQCYCWISGSDNDKIGYNANSYAVMLRTIKAISAGEAITSQYRPTWSEYDDTAPCSCPPCEETTRNSPPTDCVDIHKKEPKRQKSCFRSKRKRRRHGAQVEESDRDDVKRRNVEA